MLYCIMKNTAYFTPLFPGFHRQIRSRKPRAAQQKLAVKLALLQQKSFKQIGEVFEKFIPRSVLKKEVSGAMSRSRLFSKENTFWAFFSQVLDADGGCMEVIRKLQAYASIKGIKVPSSSTASYCTARKKLPEQMLSDILDHTADRIELYCRDDQSDRAVHSTRIRHFGKPAAHYRLRTDGPVELCGSGGRNRPFDSAVFAFRGHH
jgi:hypothetical protein